MSSRGLGLLFSHLPPQQREEAISTPAAPALCFLPHRQTGGRSTVSPVSQTTFHIFTNAGLPRAEGVQMSHWACLHLPEQQPSQEAGRRLTPHHAPSLTFTWKACLPARQMEAALGTFPVPSLGPAVPHSARLLTCAWAQSARPLSKWNQDEARPPALQSPPPITSDSIP